MSGLRIGSLCTGYGGLDMGAQAVLGGELAWYGEIEPAAVRLLEHHHPGVPNHGDLTVTDWADASPIDVLTAGWPCQPFSLAGKQKGAADERAIWPHVARAVRALRPRYVVLENVAAIAGAGELARAAGDLAALGYVGSWRCVRASDVGAPHRRERIFIVAEDTDGAARGERRLAAPGQAEGRRSRADTGRRGGAPAPHAEDDRRAPLEPCGPEQERTRPAGNHGSPANPSGDGRGEGRPEPARIVGRPDAAQRGHAVAHANGDRREGQPERISGAIEPGQQAPLGDNADGRVLEWAGYEPAIRRWERVTGRRAPAPTVLGRSGKPKLSPVFVEWLMGLPLGHITGVRGLTTNQQLKLCGNGVVPQQAAHAISLMLADRVEVAA